MLEADSNTIPAEISGQMGEMSNPSTPKSTLQFDLGASLQDLEQRLAEEQRISNTGTFAAKEEVPPPVSYAPPPEPEALPVMLEQQEDATFSSGLLDELAQEADDRLSAHQTGEQLAHMQAQRMNMALEQIARFFVAFVRHANNAAPAIPLGYRLDARTVFDRLKWHGALVDFRKQSLSAEALLDYVAFSVRYCTPEAVTVMRPWNQLDALKKELGRLGLRVLDEDDLDARKAKQEWLQARLTPEVPVQIEFRGNYPAGVIEVQCRNLNSFSVAAYRLDPAAVSAALMDDVGRVLLGRSANLPLAFQPASATPK